MSQNTMLFSMNGGDEGSSVLSAEPRTIPTAPEFTGSILTVMIPLMVLATIVLIILYFYRLWNNRRYASARNLPNAKPLYDFTVQNQKLVIGWKYGLESGVISLDDMRRMEPVQLQERLDLDNPSSSQILRLNELIPEYDRATSRSDRRRRDRMIQLRDELRQHPEAVRLKALSKQADMAIGAAREANQSVRNLSEG